MENVTLTAADGVVLDAAVHVASTNAGRGAVVLVHGITVDKDEGAMMFACRADQLGTVGSCCAVFLPRPRNQRRRVAECDDCRECLDLQAAVEYTQNRFAASLSVVAVSFGAVPTALLLPWLAASPDRLVLWDPVLDLHHTFVELELDWGKGNFGPPQRRRLAERGGTPRRCRVRTRAGPVHRVRALPSARAVPSGRRPRVDCARGPRHTRLLPPRRRTSQGAPGDRAGNDCELRPRIRYRGQGERSDHHHRGTAHRAKRAVGSPTADSFRVVSAIPLRAGAAGSDSQLLRIQVRNAAQSSVLLRHQSPAGRTAQRPISSASRKNSSFPVFVQHITCVRGGKLFINAKSVPLNPSL